MIGYLCAVYFSFQEVVSTGMMKYKVHAEYFGYDAEQRKDKMRTAAETVKKISFFIETSLRELDSSFPNVVREWINIKSYYLELLDNSEKERKLAKEEYERSISLVHKELGQAYHDLSLAKSEINTMEIHALQLTSHVAELRPLKPLLTETRDKLEKMTASRTELVRELENLRSAHTRLQEDSKAREITLTELADQRKKQFDESSKNLLEALDKTMELQEQLLREIDSRRAVQLDFDAFKERDRHRLEALNTTSVQCEPPVADIAIQTEFICPPVSRDRIYPVHCASITSEGSVLPFRLLCFSLNPPRAYRTRL